MCEELQVTDSATQNSQTQRKGFPFRYIFLFSIVATLGGCLGARGNGTPNFAYFLIAVVLLPLAAKKLGKRFSRIKSAQFVVFLAGAVACFLLAFLSARPSPAKVFEQVFNRPPPSSARELACRKQYFDGFIYLLSFQMDDASFDDLQLQANLEATDLDHPVERIWSHTSTWTSIAQSDWPRDPPSSNLNAFVVARERRQGVPVDEPTTYMYIIRDLPTGRVWVVYVRD
jgi:hypothetical protein